MATATKNPRKVITGKVRLSYVHLFEPYSNSEDQAPKFSTAVLIPKKDTKTYNALIAAEKAAAEAGMAKFGGKVPKVLASIIQDGDEDEDKLETNPERAGHWVMTVSNKQKPGIVDVDLDPILDSTEVYSGCYARVSITAFAYNFNGKKGISFGLNHVQKLEDGVPLGSVSRAEDDFGDDDDLLG